MSTNLKQTFFAGFHALSVLILGLFLVASTACGDDAQKVRDQSLGDAGADAIADSGADATPSGQPDAGAQDAAASDGDDRSDGIADARPTPPDITDTPDIRDIADSRGQDAAEEDAAPADAGTRDATPDARQDVTDGMVDDVGPGPEPEVVEPTTCTHGDGVCPAGCDITRDDDCQLDCRDASSWPADWVAFEDEVLRLTNLERAAGATCGGQAYPPVGALSANDQLREAARCHSEDMALHNNRSHTGSDGSGPGERIGRTGYQFRGWAENIAFGYASPAQVVAGWMRSPGHCKNIMSSRQTELGVGYWLFSADPSRYKHYWTQNFARPR